MLDKDSAIPLYVQLQRSLRERVLRGDFEQGDFLPSENTMMKEFQTTRSTVRKALSQLANEGLVRQIRGKGTCVSFSKLKYSILNFGGFSDYLKNRNETPVSKILEQGMVSIDGRTYFKLKRARGTQKDGTILYLTIDTSLVPLDVFPGIDQHDFSRASLYSTMRDEYQVYPARAEIVLSAVEITTEQRETLQVSEDTVTLMQAQGVVRDSNQVEIEKVTVLYSPEIEFKLITNIQ